jgi:hypothetical protein
MKHLPARPVRRYARAWSSREVILWSLNENQSKYVFEIAGCFKAVASPVFVAFFEIAV